MNVYKNICDKERRFFFEMKEECKVSCVQLVASSIVAQKGSNMLFFYIFEYGSEYGAECSVLNGISFN